jgi:hypothetical protein
MICRIIFNSASVFSEAQDTYRAVFRSDFARRGRSGNENAFGISLYDKGVEDEFHNVFKSAVSLLTHYYLKDMGGDADRIDERRPPG